MSLLLSSNPAYICPTPSCSLLLRRVYIEGDPFIVCDNCQLAFCQPSIEAKEASYHKIIAAKEAIESLYEKEPKNGQD